MNVSRGMFLARWFYLACTCLLLAAGAELRAASPAPFRYARMGVANGCFVESVALGDELRTRFGADTWYRLLQWGAKDGDDVVVGHAVMVFEHRGKLWAYDINHAFTALDVPPAQRDDVAAVAKQVTAPYVDKITPRFPIYREDFPQAPDPSPRVVSSDVEENDIRDAGLVAEGLAKSRPVTLVEFSYPKGEETQRGAAVAFIYNGRLCVYSPAYGTVPFRVQAISVKNLRQLQELVRRIHPAAANFKVR